MANSNSLSIINQLPTHKIVSKKLTHLDKSIKHLAEVAEYQQTSHEDMAAAIAIISSQVKDLKILIEFDLEERLRALERAVMYRY